LLYRVWVVRQSTMVSRSNRRLVINIEMENFDRERMKMIWRFLGLVLGYKTCDTMLDY
jgi:hypothetical protein